jgi:hypothetical protein
VVQVLCALSVVQLTQYAQSAANNHSDQSTAWFEQLKRAVTQYPAVYANTRSLIHQWNPPSPLPLAIFAISGFRFAMGIYTFFIWLTVVGLLHYHCVLVSSALTTNEKVTLTPSSQHRPKCFVSDCHPSVNALCAQIKGKFRHHTNPHDKGCLPNWSRLCCSPLPHSDVPDLHQLVDA